MCFSSTARPARLSRPWYATALQVGAGSLFKLFRRGGSSQTVGSISALGTLCGSKPAITHDLADPRGGGDAESYVYYIADAAGDAWLALGFRRRLSLV